MLFLNFHKRICPSCSLASVMPSVETAETASLILSGPRKVALSLAVDMSHTCTSPPESPLTSVFPSGEKAIVMMLLGFSLRRAISAPVCASYNQMPVLVATTNCVPSGTNFMSCICPLPKRSVAPSGRCHRVYAGATTCVWVSVGVSPKYRAPIQRSNRLSSSTPPMSSTGIRKNRKFFMRVSDFLSVLRRIAPIFHIPEEDCAVTASTGKGFPIW